MTCTIPNCTEPATCGASWQRVCEKHWSEVETIMLRDTTDDFAASYQRAVRVVSKNAATQDQTK